VVFRRSATDVPGDGTRGTDGAAVVSFVEFLDSHENGPVSFLGGGSAGCGLSFGGAGGGGGDQGTDGSDPWNPIRPAFTDVREGNEGFGESSTSAMISGCINLTIGNGSGRNAIPLAADGAALGSRSTSSSRFTLSRLEVERR